MINKIKYTMLTFLFLNIFHTATAQTALPCGNGKINDSALAKAILFEKTNRTTVVNYLVRIFFHVFHNDDGTNAAASSSQISSEFNSLLASYTSDNICFLFAGIDSSNSTNLNQNFNADSDPTGAALNTFQVPGCINIFYMQKINGNNNACNPPCGYGGIALGGIPGTFCLISAGNIGPGNTIGHEVGHCMGLLHTFETAFGQENINGSNSTTNGDKITDTPADPFAYNGNSCFSTNASGCTYTGTCTDPNNQTNFTPPYSNLMGYWWNGASVICVANPVATTGQFTRVNSFLNTNTPLINCSSPASVIITPVTISSGYFMQSAINAVSTSGNVVLNGSTISTLGGSIVMLEPGFTASPAANGKIHIIIKPCN